MAILAVNPMVVCSGLLLLLLNLQAKGVAASAGKSRFRGRAAGSISKAAVSDHRMLLAEEVEKRLSASLESAYRSNDPAARQRLANVEASMWRTFAALPKNDEGRLAPRGVRYLIYSYFMKEHGWLINGLEPHGMQENVTELHEVMILQDKAPAFVEALLESRREGRGLSLADAVALALALERLIFDESLALLEAAYLLNGQTVVDQVDEDELHEVLQSYLLIFERGVKGGNLTDVQSHQSFKKNVASIDGSWPLLTEFEQDAVRNYDFNCKSKTNPFVERRYSFQTAARVVENLAQDYGKWQNTECRQMKEELMSLDPDGSGRVPLSTFYAQPANADYQFTESTAYLRQIGALEEGAASSGAEPKVRIANYLAGPSNCIASSTYYSVCCLSDCEGIMNQLEGRIKAPTASPEQLLAALRNVTSASDLGELPNTLGLKLHDIAEKNSGEVPLHGRLFAQFLHFAFPTECPYPHISESASVLTLGHWLDKKAFASKEERQRVVEEASDNGTAGSDAVEKAEPLAHWSDEEVLPVQEKEVEGPGSLGRRALRLAMQLAAIAAALHGAFKARHALLGGGCGKKEDFVLPLRL